MRAIFGLLLVMLGLAMAVVWMPEHDSERQLAVATDIATKGFTRQQAGKSGDTDRDGRTFSPRTPLLATVEPPGAKSHVAAVARIATPVPDVVPPAMVTAVQPTATASSIVTGSFASVTPPVQVPMAARSAGAPEMARDELVRNLQRELKRVGCYQGEIDGDWGSGSRRAMSTFTDRVNASLPLDQPDFVLLTLLKGHTGVACGRECPSGQTLSQSGRCVANAVVAQQTPRRATEARSAERPRDPPAEAVAAPPAPAASGAWDTRVSRPMETLASPSLTTAAAVAAGATAAAIAYAQLPGRMSVGAPVTAAAPMPGAVAPPPPSLAQNAVRSANNDNGERAARRSTSRRERAERPARQARRAGPQVAGYRSGPSVVVYRAAPRYITPPAYYASAPRRPSRSWTSTFFGMP